MPTLFLISANDIFEAGYANALFTKAVHWHDHVLAEHCDRNLQCERSGVVFIQRSV